MRLRPIAPAVVQPAAQEQFAQAMAAPLQILAHIIARPAQIADRFLLRRRRPHLRQQPRAEQLGQLARVAAIGLDPLARLARDQRRRNHLARHARRRQLALQRVATRPGFITRLHRARCLPLELPDQPPHGGRLVGDRPRHRRRLVPDQHRDEQILLVRIDARRTW